MLQERATEQIKVRLTRESRERLEALVAALSHDQRYPVSLTQAVNYAIHTASASVAAGNGGPARVAVSHPIQGK